MLLPTGCPLKTNTRDHCLPDCSQHQKALKHPCVTSRQPQEAHPVLGKSWVHSSLIRAPGSKHLLTRKLSNTRSKAVLVRVWEDWAGWLLCSVLALVGHDLQCGKSKQRQGVLFPAHWKVKATVKETGGCEEEVLLKVSPQGPAVALFRCTVTLDRSLSLQLTFLTTKGAQWHLPSLLPGAQ